MKLNDDEREMKIAEFRADSMKNSFFIHSFNIFSIYSDVELINFFSDWRYYSHYQFQLFTEYFNGKLV